MKNRALTVVLIAALTILSIHLLGQVLEGSRADFTADQAYSLSEGTIGMLERMQQEGVEPIDLTLYFSRTAGKSLPKFIKDFVGYERYLRALLGEYERAADGKIRLDFVDPVPDSDEAQNAADFGLDGKPINQHGDLFYFGLVVETQTGSRAVIDFFWPDRQETVEYEIANRIHSLIWPTKSRVGVLSSLEVLGTADNPYLAQMLAAQGKRPQETWLILQLLRETADVQRIDPETDRISKDDFDLVVVIHPKGLSGKAQWALDEWIVTGGRALVLLDPYALDDQAPQNPQQPWAALQYRPSSNLAPLMAAWGIERVEDSFAADFDLAVRRPVDRRGGIESVVVDLAIDEPTFDQTLAADHPVLQGLGSLRFFLAGVLDIEEKEGVVVTPLVRTTSAGNRLEIHPGIGAERGNLAYTDLNNAAALRDAFTPGDEPVIVAAMIQGSLPSAFPEGADFPSQAPTPPQGWPPGVPPPVDENAEMMHKDPVPAEELAETTVILFADVDFISDQVGFERSLFGVQTANDNYKLFLNAVDFLLGSDELMAVRARRVTRRPFTRFDEIESEAEKESLERERELREEIAEWQQELQEKQSDLTQRNAALFQKQLADEVDRLNERITAANRELFEIRKARRASLESEEAKVRFAVMGWMPILVLGLGITLFSRRRARDWKARG